jgi:hypothetical protein
MESEQLHNPAPQDAPETQAPQTEPQTLDRSWWEALEFEGKDFTELSPENVLMLKATPFAPARNLQPLTPENAGAVIKALQDKFPAVEARVSDLATEWNETEDKTRLASKLSIAKEYLLHAIAIGDFTPLYQQVARWDNTLHEAHEKSYAAREALAQKAEKLSDGEPDRDATQAFKELIDEWKAMPPMDKERADLLWQRIERARDVFFERKRLRHDAEQSELSSNLDLKTELVEKAERHAASDNWKEATEGFKNLMDEWKAIGRTFNDKNESLWQRFITAKNVFYDRKKQHFESIQSEQEVNLDAKVKLVEEAEQLASSTEWGKTSGAYGTIMDKWKAIGRVPAERADELWDRLSKAKDTFFNAKRQHFANVRVALDDNYAQKAALVARAQKLSNSTDWRGATDEFADLMDAWKKIGRVAHEHSDALWESFTAARRQFFNRKDADRDRRRVHIERAQQDRLSQTHEFLSRLRDELKEDEESLADYHLSLGNLTGGKKDDLIRANLEKLIAQSGPRMEKKREKIKEVEAQLSSMSRGTQPKRGKGGENATEAAPAPDPQG